MNEWNQEGLSSFLDNKSAGLIYFYTPLCGTCQVASRMLLVIETMVKVEIGKMNLNYHPDVARKFAVESVPCLMVIQKGLVVETIYAFHSVPYLLDKIKELLT
jgi:thioredoxin-like negative regulator of GroEL